MARGINMAFKGFTNSQPARAGYWDNRETNNGQWENIWFPATTATPSNMPDPSSLIRGGPGEGDWTGVNPLTGQRERIYMTPSGDLPGEQGWESDNPNSTEGWLLQGGVKDTGNDWFDNLVIGGIGAIAGQGLWGALSPAAGAADAASVG